MERGPRAQALAARSRRALGRARRRSGGGPGLALRRSHARRGDVLLLAFGYEHPAFDPAAQADLERALQAFFPEAELVASDGHDWIAVPFSRGTWATATVGRAELLSAERFPPHRQHRVRDLRRGAEEPGWIEGALRAGAAAARWAAAAP